MPFLFVYTIGLVLFVRFEHTKNRRYIMIGAIIPVSVRLVEIPPVGVELRDYLPDRPALTGILQTKIVVVCFFEGN